MAAEIPKSRTCGSRPSARSHRKTTRSAASSSRVRKPLKSIVTIPRTKSGRNREKQYLVVREENGSCQAGNLTASLQAFLAAAQCPGICGQEGPEQRLADSASRGPVPIFPEVAH